ncbi:MAG: inositol monophosphatase family protein [Acidimicrobiales bacterium]
MTADGEAVLDLLDEAAAAIATAVGALDDRGLAGTKPWQYRTDLAADAAAAEVLDGAGVGVLSEESGLRNAHAEVVVVLDPVDGSTNAAGRAVVRHQPVRRRRRRAVGGAGRQPRHRRAFRRRARHRRPPQRPTDRAVGHVSARGVDRGVLGYPPRYLGWRQYRALGALALDLCAVASGVLDGYLDCSPSAHGVWDYLGGALICAEAGATVSDAEDARSSCSTPTPGARPSPAAPWRCTTSSWRCAPPGRGRGPSRRARATSTMPASVVIASA